MRSLLAAFLAGTALSAISVAAEAACPATHNVILFVADGLRPTSVTPDVAPTMTRLWANGVKFDNSHSIFPTFTTANASVMATGHFLGDTGDFSNTIYAGFAVPAANNSVTPFLENDIVLKQMDAHFGGNYLNEETVLAAARLQGCSTASIGKVGPVQIFDVTENSGQFTIIVDDATGTANGVPLSAEMTSALTGAGIPLVATPRVQPSGNNTTAGTKVANVAQQQYFATVATNVVLPLFAKRHQPFVMVFWSRDPDGTQHNQGDSLNSVTPGINGATSKAAVRNADTDLAQLMSALNQLGLAATTNVILTSDHGFSTISKQSATSPTTQRTYAGTNAGFLPKGFVAADLATGLNLPLFDPDVGNAQVDPTKATTAAGNALIGANPANPTIVVAANGGSDLIYVPSGDVATLKSVVSLLSAQDYVSGIFVDDAFGAVDGTLPMSAIGLKGSAVTPQPSIAVNFKSFDTGCGTPTACTVEVADTSLQQGQGMHGSFSRGDTRNTMGAIGPDFRKGFVDPAPASNADLGMTIAQLLNLTIPAKGKLVGRVLTEAMPGGVVPVFSASSVSSTVDSSGNVTKLDFQTVGNTPYFDAAGYVGRTVGLQ